MNSTGGKTPSTPRLSEYATNALEKIRKELRMFSIGDVQVSWCLSYYIHPIKL